MLISDLHLFLESCVSGIILQNRRGSPYHLLGADILQMVQSYLKDSEFFLGKGDIVNQFASLVYAFGWLDAGSYLGLYHSSSDPECLERIVFPKLNMTGNTFVLKTDKYLIMLGNAILSVSVFPCSRLTPCPCS